VTTPGDDTTFFTVGHPLGSSVRKKWKKERGELIFRWLGLFYKKNNKSK